MWLEAALVEMPKWGIDTNEEMSSFLAQVAHESDQFTRLVENLNYSAPRLMEIWPRRFPTLDIAMLYSRSPEKLANFVYNDASRADGHKLGNTRLGDGWRFRGRGPIQITGRTNYGLCATGIGFPLIDDPDLLVRDPGAGIRSACWLWKTKGLDALDDDSDVAPETRLVNGGVAGLALRQSYFDKLKSALEA